MTEATPNKVEAPELLVDDVAVMELAKAMFAYDENHQPVRYNLPYVSLPGWRRHSYEQAAEAALAVMSHTPDERIAGLVSALEPFALEAENYDYGDGSGPDLKDAPDESSLNEINDLRVGHLRAARKAVLTVQGGN